MRYYEDEGKNTDVDSKKMLKIIKKNEVYRFQGLEKSIGLITKGLRDQVILTLQISNLHAKEMTSLKKNCTNTS